MSRARTTPTASCSTTGCSRRGSTSAPATIVAPSRVPQGSTYLFLDLRQYSAGYDCMSVLERIAEAGVLLAPGSAFGAQYDGWARLCFTAVDPDRLVVGIERVNHVLST